MKHIICVSWERENDHSLDTLCLLYIFALFELACARLLDADHNYGNINRNFFLIRVKLDDCKQIDVIRNDYFMYYY